MHKKFLGSSFLAAGFLTAGLLTATSAHAAVVSLTFEGLKDLEPIQNFYNNGTGGLGSGPGTNYGITFGDDALAVIDSDQGGSGNFANEPTPDTIAFFLSGPGVVMNVAQGFTTGFSFFYTSLSFTGSVSVYDGLNSTGNLLATLTLPATGSSGNGDPTGDFDTWAPIGVAFSGTAKSVNFSGSANQIGFDNITLGADTPIGAVPEPLTMLGVGTAYGFGTLFKKRLSKKQK